MTNKELMEAIALEVTECVCVCSPMVTMGGLVFALSALMKMEAQRNTAPADVRVLMAALDRFGDLLLLAAEIAPEVHPDIARPPCRPSIH